jgi:hypothetical protein
MLGGGAGGDAVFVVLMILALILAIMTAMAGSRERFTRIQMAGCRAIDARELARRPRARCGRISPST